MLFPDVNIPVAEQPADPAPRTDEPEGRRPLQELQPSSEPEEEPKKEEAFEPKDSSGRPLFGLRALKKTVTTTESVQERSTSSGKS